MPEYWHNEKSARDKDKEENCNGLYERIVASKKPYFMNYRYAKQLSQYKKYESSAQSKCRREFNIQLNELLVGQNDSDRQKQFIYWYYKKIPSGIGSCIMNRICWAVSDYVDIQKNVWSETSKSFDYSIYKSGVEYSKRQYNSIIDLYNSYHEQYMKLAKESKTKYCSIQALAWKKACLFKVFQENLMATCFDDEVICDVLLDITYGRGSPNSIPWDVCGNIIIRNLLRNNNNILSYIQKSKDGDIIYQGDNYSILWKDDVI
jgi:hypothetical protein